MNERQISEKESLAIIEEMICRTRRRLDIGAGNQMLLWGYLTLGVAVLTTAAIIFLRTPHANWLWFLLPAIGYPICYRMRRRRRNACTPVTYVDLISAGLWRASAERRSSVRCCAAGSWPRGITHGPSC